MFDYSAIAATASALLAKFGQLVTFTRRTVTAFDGATGVETLGTAVTFTGYGAGFAYKLTEIGGNVEAGDLRLICEAMTTPPAIGDVATYNGTNYRVMDVDELSPGGVVCRYALQLRV